MEIGPESDYKQPKWLPKRDQDKRLEARSSGEFLGVNISNEGSKPGILSRIAQTTAAFSRLKIIWRDRNISLASYLLLKLRWCGRSSYPPSFMLLELDLDSRTREKDPSPWDEMLYIGDFWTFPTKTMWRTRRNPAAARMQLECTMIS